MRNLNSANREAVLSAYLDERQLAPLDYTEYRFLADAQFGRLLRKGQESWRQLGGGWLRCRAAAIDLGEVIDPVGKGTGSIAIGGVGFDVRPSIGRFQRSAALAHRRRIEPESGAAEPRTDVD